MSRQYSTVYMDVWGWLHMQDILVCVFGQLQQEGNVNCVLNQTILHRASIVTRVQLEACPWAVLFCMEVQAANNT